MSDGSVIGLGAMGSAVARALLRCGNRVTVWNRTSAKAEPLGRDGATVAADAASAVAASPVVLVSVENYAVSGAIFSGADVTPHLAGRVVVQLSTGSPQQARDSECWFRNAGAGYLDCAVLAYSYQIGTPEAALLAAGEKATFKRCEPLLQSLAGGLTDVGERIGAASTLDCAALSFMVGALLGALMSQHKLPQREGEWYAPYIEVVMHQGCIKFWVRDGRFGRRIPSEPVPDDEPAFAVIPTTDEKRAEHRDVEQPAEDPELRFVQALTCSLRTWLHR